MLHVGVYLHKRVSQIAVLTGDGAINQYRVPNDATRLEQFFATLPAARVAIEATGTWWWLVDLVERASHLVESEADEGHRGRAPEERPRRRGAARPAPPRRSAPQVWIPPAELREARELLRYRLSLVSIRTIVKNRLNRAPGAP
jgi:transposase